MADGVDSPHRDWSPLMFTRIGAFTVRRRRSVLTLSLVGLILAAPVTSISINLFRELKQSGFFDEAQPPAAGDREASDP